VEDGFGHFPVMFVLHVALIAGCVVEPLLGHRAFVPALGWTMLAVTVAANVLRWWCISTLGSRWAARVIVLPGAPLVRSGPYRWVGLPGRADRRGARRRAGPGGGPRPLPRGRPARRLRAGLAEGLRPGVAADRRSAVVKEPAAARLPARARRPIRPLALFYGRQPRRPGLPFLGRLGLVCGHERARPSVSPARNRARIHR
jgi:hypothetical protein